MAFSKASSITVPEILFRTHKTGFPELDNAFSETSGIVPSQVTLVTGKPGSGKTTLCLLASSRLSLHTARPGAFISLEMSDFQLALSAKKIPGFSTLMVEDTFSLASLVRDIRKLNPSSVVLDSIQKAAGMLVAQKESPNFNQAQKEIVNALYKLAKETFIPVFLIGHCGKNGNYIGPSHLEHEVDSHMTVDYDRDLGLRHFSFGKNRFGGVVDPQLFGISSTGVWIGTPYDSPSDSDHDSSPATPLSRVYGAWKSEVSSLPRIDATQARLVSQATIDTLKVLDSDRISRDSHIGDPSRIKLTYTYSGVAQCAWKKGEIRIGKKMTDSNFRIGSIGYAKEQPFIMRNVLTREELFLWILCHEWVHLFRGMQHHKNEFFREVEKTYKKLMATLA